MIITLINRRWHLCNGFFRGCSLDGGWRKHFCGNLCLNCAKNRPLNGNWPSDLLDSVFPLHCVSTVDLWTQAVSTMAWEWAVTSCSSWHKMQVSTSLCIGVEPRWGPTATHNSICIIGQLHNREKIKMVTLRANRFMYSTYRYEYKFNYIRASHWNSIRALLLTSRQRQWVLLGSHSLACSHTASCWTQWSSSASLTSAPWSSVGAVWLPPPSSSVQPYPCPGHSGETNETPGITTERSGLDTILK